MYFPKLPKIEGRMRCLLFVLISSFRRADELADAMDARCYSGSKNRTRYKKMQLSWRDLVGTLTIAGVITGVVFLNITGFLAVAL